MARKYYNEGLYEVEENSLNKIIAFSKDNNLRAKALLELGYVKYLSGYSENVWQYYIKKAAEESSELTIEPYYPKIFIHKIKEMRAKIKPKIKIQKKKRKLN